MIKKINDFLAGWQMTITGGLFLIASFILPRMGYGKYELLAWPCVIICGLPLLYLAIYRIIYNKGISKISSALLISMAMIAALLIGDLFAAGEVAFIMELGALLEDMTTDRAKKGLKNLISLAPSTGRLILDGKETIIPVERIQKDDVIRVLPGETIPVDGIIIAGETSIDQSVMTGESLPVDKTVGDSVYSGTINRFGSIDFKATKVGQDSSLQKLIKMVEDADKNQASTQRIADKWASWLVPVALFIAILAYVITGDIVRAVTVMVVFCPCALVLATPTAIMAAIGQATKHGVIIKSGEALEKMGKVSTIAFDKTGTLTYGKLEVTDIIPTRELSETDLLRIAASIESRSEHPLGKAVVEKAKANDIELADISDFKMEAGKGITATINNAKYYLGSETYIKNIGVPMPQNATTVLNNLGLEGKATIIIADENNIIGIISLSDVIRPEAREVIRQLEAMNTSTLLLTGDNLKTASFFASKVGINDVHAGLLPGEKMDYIKKFKENGKICMIGDGVNDAPALKLADVGVAMGAIGSDIAIEAADVALMSDDITNLPYLKWLSNTTVKTIKAAITLSMCINLVAVTMSVLGILNPTTGALVHNAGSCFVVLLAALLYDRNYSFN
ncbi:MAG: cation-translocating P-type ATPase [Pseudobutyrivibrio ruminis]|nr:cation-translocating P-type ATPase [Pseudobutyrivibrio ruminis]